MGSVTMKSTTPNLLKPHRVFFTEFDRYTSAAVIAVNEDDALMRPLERKLKLLILTKAHVVIAVSQLLESPLAHKLLNAYPNLLRTEAIIPSLRSEYDTSAKFLEWKRQEACEQKNNPYHTPQAEQIARLIDENGTAVRWALTDMSNWFRDRLTNDLEDERSLIHLGLRQNSVLMPAELPTQIRSKSTLSRNDVYQITAATGNDDLRNLVSAYADFIYYLSGARTTKSEGVLPQENLLDFAISDLLDRKTRLTEFEVFFKVFIDTVKAKTSTIFPTDFLDAISIMENPP
jgi:hypothetical protein